MRVRRSLALAVLLAIAVAGCADDKPGWQPTKRSFSDFRTEVMPVLLRDCAFPTCHGSSERFFRVWGPGRVRIEPLDKELDPLRSNEASRTFSLALSMIDSKDPAKSLLLRKPLAVEAGGSGHRGADKFGRNVYRTVNDSGYLAIARWVFAVSQ